jgi:hypothetical protein
MKLTQTETSNIKKLLTGCPEFFLKGITCSVAASVLKGKVEVHIFCRNKY